MKKNLKNFQKKKKNKINKKFNETSKIYKNQIIKKRDKTIETTKRHLGLIIANSVKTDDFWNCAPVLGQLMGLPLALLNYNYPHKGFRYCFPPSLKTWMRRIAAAEFVLTDSFHGVAFSIINKKQFVNLSVL